MHYFLKFRFKLKYNDIILNYEKNIIFYNTNVIYDNYIIPNNIINNYICKHININNNNKAYIDYNYTYTIISLSLKYNIKIFNIKDTFIKYVSKFKLANARAYYDGNNVYLTPSCISAHMTFMNLNYDKINYSDYNLYNTYRMRGYGTWLFNDDIDSILEYSINNYLWKNLYTLHTFKGNLNSNNKLFYPRLYNYDIYNNYINLTNRYLITINEPILYINLLNLIYKSNETILLNYNDLSAIDDCGNIIPIKKWIIYAHLKN